MKNVFPLLNILLLKIVSLIVSLIREIFSIFHGKMPYFFVLNILFFSDKYLVLLLYSPHFGFLIIYYHYFFSRIEKESPCNSDSNFKNLIFILLDLYLGIFLFLHYKLYVITYALLEIHIHLSIPYKE